MIEICKFWDFNVTFLCQILPNSISLKKHLFSIIFEAINHNKLRKECKYDSNLCDEEVISLSSIKFMTLIVLSLMKVS